MKLSKVVPAAAVLYVLFMSGSATLTSCTKDGDTTIIRDTVIVTDTVTVKDTTCRLYAGLVAYYNFTDGSLNDSSGYGNNIIFNNAVKTSGRSGKPNSAYQFNGSSSYMQIRNHPSLNPSLISIVATFKLNDFYYGPCHASQIIGKGTADQSNGVYCLRVRDKFTVCSDPVDTTTEYLYAAYGNNIQSVAATGATTDPYYINTKRWYTVIFTYDGDTSRIYVDGEMKGQELIKTAQFTANAQDIFIGKSEYSSFPYWFNGVIDELRIYNRPLNEKEIKQLSELKN
ncbi:MAG TPA: LamG domain-containing protein [Chitinophaga sp.]